MNIQQYNQAKELITEINNLEELQKAIVKSYKSTNGKVSLNINSSSVNISVKFYNKVKDMIESEIVEKREEFRGI